VVKAIEKNESLSCSENCEEFDFFFRFYLKYALKFCFSKEEKKKIIKENNTNSKMVPILISIFNFIFEGYST